MKLVTIIGTRPEFIRLSRIIPLLDSLCTQVIVHTGQNFDPKLNEIFFKELSLREPDYYLDATGSFAEQLAIIATKLEKILKDEKPDKFLVLGDTNSSLGGIIARRLGIPVFHMEAGNRCYDDRIPEEVNRKLIDHSSTVLMPYTERSRANLVREGIDSASIFVTGNPIFEVLNFYKKKINASKILSQLKLKAKKYILVTAHRQETVDLPEKLSELVQTLQILSKETKLPIIVSTHPRTKKQLAAEGIRSSKNVQFLEPFGFFDFIMLEQSAALVVSDSGTVQEECAILKVPCLTIRDTTERPETLECGTNVLVGVSANTVIPAAKAFLNGKMKTDWTAPAEYLKDGVSQTVAKIIMSELPNLFPRINWTK